MLRPHRIGALCATLAGFALAALPARDLDVGVPPGSPLAWGQGFPAVTPGRGELFPTTPSGARPTDPGPGRSAVQPRRPDMDVRLASSFGLVRILTWDITAHLSWLSGELDAAPVTGAARALPEPGEALYWICLAPLLRRMLHPALVSEHELTAHLVELGEPVLGVLDDASSENDLEAICAEVRARVRGKAGRRAPKASEDPREAMLARWVIDELVRVHPYDPEAAFGRRLFLFADELQPLIAHYALYAEDDFLRRNATSALGRYRTAAAMEALGRVAVESQDPVTYTRALAALGAFRSMRDAGPLIERMKSTSDEVERVTILGALGRMGRSEAATDIVELAARKKQNDPELQMTALTALARIRNPDDQRRVQRYAEDMERTARSRPRGFRVEHGATRPDIPEDKDARAEIIHALAVIVQARLDPGDEGLRRKVLALLPQADDDRRVRRGEAYSLRTVAPPVQMVLLEALGDFGAQATAALAAVVRDARAEAAVRGHALAQMAWSDREPLVAAIASDARESNEMKIQALEIMAADRHEKLEEVGRELLADLARLEPGSGKADARYLYLSALRALSTRRMLKTDDLLPLVTHVATQAIANETGVGRVKRLVDELVDRTVQGARQAERKRRIEELLTLVIAEGVNPQVNEDTRGEKRKYVEGQVEGLRSHGADPSYVAKVRVALMTTLVGRVVDAPNRDRAEFEPAVLLEEEILMSLGRTGTAEAAAALSKVVEDEDSVYRATACLALGASGQPVAARYLVRALVADDPFVRLCAYEALKYLTGEDHFADWIYGDEHARTVAAGEYAAWSARRR
jgi:HEAT repeat protein